MATHIAPTTGGSQQAGNLMPIGWPPHAPSLVLLPGGQGDNGGPAPVPHAEGTPAGGTTNAQGLGFNLDTSLILAHGVDVTGSTTGRVSPGSSGSPTPTGGNVGAPTSQTPGAPQADGGSSQASPTYNVPPPQTSTDTGGFLGLSTTTLLLIAGAIVLFMVVRK